MNRHRHTNRVRDGGGIDSACAQKSLTIETRTLRPGWL